MATRKKEDLNQGDGGKPDWSLRRKGKYGTQKKSVRRAREERAAENRGKSPKKKKKDDLGFVFTF